MTADKFREMLAGYRQVGQVSFEVGKLMMHGVLVGRIGEAEAGKTVECIWHDLGDLLDEFARLAEDHRRMTYTLEQINRRVVDAMQGTAKSTIAEDWWSAVMDEDGIDN